MRNFGCNIKEISANIKAEIKSIVEKVHPALSVNNENHIVLDYDKAKVSNDFEASYLFNRALRDIDAWINTEFAENPSMKSNWYHRNSKVSVALNLLPNNVTLAFLNKLDMDARIEEQEISAEYDKKIAEEGAKALQDETWGSLDSSIEFAGNYNDPYFNLDDGDVKDTSFNGVPNITENIILQKENLLSDFRHRLSKVQSDKNYFKNHKEVYANLLKEEQYLTDTIEGTKDSIGLIQEIENLKATTNLDVFLMFADNDMVRMQQMMERGTPEDLMEIRKMIEFYDASTTFEAGTSNPIFSQDHIFDEDFNIKLPKDLLDKMQEFRDTIEVLKNKLYGKDVEAIMTRVDSITDRANMKPLTRDEVFSTNGRKDTHWLDSFIMDTTNGILSENGPLAQAMSITLRDTLSDYKIRAKSFENRVNELTPKLAKKLPGLNGLGFKASSYDIFRAKNKKGQYRDNITQRYTYDFFKFISDTRNSLNQNLRLAYTEENPVERSRKIGIAYNANMNTLRENTYAINILNIKSLAGENYVDDNGVHEQKLKEQLGEKGFQKEIAKQLELMQEFNVKREIYLDELLSHEGVFIEEDLSEGAKSSLKDFDLQYNPVIVAEAFYNFKTVKNSKGVIIYQNPKFTHLIPRKNKGNIVFDNDFAVKDSDTDLDYYDDNFAVIEADEDLEAFHSLLTEFSSEIIGAMPPEIKSKFNLNSIPQMRKSIAEVLVDPNLTALQKISQAFKQFMDNIRIMFGEKVMNPFSHAPINVVTGKPDYTINPENLEGNRQYINERYNVESVFLAKVLGIEANEINNSYRKSIEVKNLNSNTIDYLRTQLEPQAFSYLMQQERIQPFVELREAITHQIVSEQSFDLPKVLKYFSDVAMQYQARNKVLPLLAVMKEHYENINNIETTGLGKAVVNAIKGDNRPKGKRLEAIKQMESWFNRNALGNYTSSDTLGDTTQKQNEDIKLLSDKLKATINNKIYTFEEKEVKSRLEEAIASLESELENTTDIEKQKDINKQINRLNNQLAYLGRTRSGKAFIASLYNWIRFLGLGYNIKSQITNFLEGQSANIIGASSGKYFSPDNLYRANQIVSASFMKNASFGHIVTADANKNRIFMDRFDVLQDASSDLQKASTSSAVSGSLIDNLKPYSFMSKVEFMNQSAIMISVLLDQEITGIDGTKSNVWDATDRNGKLLPNFATKENVDNWENRNGEQFKQFNTHLNKAIIDIHGDYDGLRGSRMTESLLFTPLMMFKRWLPRQLYNRFGVEQQDLETGMSTVRGRYRDHTMTTGVLQGAMYGLAGVAVVGAGPIGIIMGSVLGGALVKVMGNQGKIEYKDGTSGLVSLMQESAFIIKETVLNLARLPINSIAGRAVIKSGDYSNFKGKDEVAIQNLRANIMELSMMLGITALMLVVKGFAYDDEDDENSTRRKVHNYFVNTLMQMSSSLSQYTNPVDMYSMFKTSASTQFMENLGKFLGSLNTYLATGDATVASGPYAGENSIKMYGSKVAIPSLLKFDNAFGFGTAMKKQYEPSYFDNMFYGEDKKAKNDLGKIKSKAKKAISELDLSEEEIERLEKELNRRTRKKKKESYLESLQRVKDLRENGDLDFTEADAQE